MWEVDVMGSSVYGWDPRISVAHNEWHHCAITIDSNNIIRAFVDGKLIDTCSYLVPDNFYSIGGILYSNLTVYEALLGPKRLIGPLCISNICKYTSDFTPNIKEWLNEIHTVYINNEIVYSK